MIVLSLVLVIAAAVLLVLGVFQDGLVLIYLSIGSCLLAMALLGVGVLLRRRESSTDRGTVGSGAAAATAGSAIASPPARPRPQDASSDGPDRDETVRVQPAKKAVVRKRAAIDEREPAPASEPFAPERTEAASAAAGGAAAAGAGRRGTGKKSVVKKAVVKKAVRRAGAPSAEATGASPAGAAGSSSAAAGATKKSAAKKSAAKKSAAKKSAAKKASGGSGASRLANVKGLGPAKQQALLDQFGSEKGLRDATIEEMTRVRGVGPGLARSIKDALS